MNSFVNKQMLPKRKIVLITMLLAVFMLGLGGFYPASGDAATSGTIFSPPESFSDLAESASPAVVNIRTVKTIKGGGRVFRHFQKSPFGDDDPMKDFFDRFFDEDQNRNFKQRSLGSGFIIDKDGYIVTNNHVIDNADKIVVILNNEKEFEAQIIGRDKNTDLALIKIDSHHNLPVLRFGNSDTLKVGQWVVAIGNPFGLEHTVTAGIVSAKGRVIGSGPYDDFIQTDASINPGNSGGPLLNMKGEVVGINTAIVAGGQGIGFAIPVNLAKNIIGQLKNSGEVTRGWLGVGIQDISEEVAEYYGIKEKNGVLVTEVFPGDPADAAGIKPKDIIVSVNGKAIDSARKLTGIIADTSVGDRIQIDVVRNGKTKTFNVKVAKREETKISRKSTPDENKEQLGIRVADITPEIASKFNLKDAKGVIVVNVDAESKAAEAGLQIHDIIIEINHRNISSANDFDNAINKVPEGKTINLFIRRMNRGFLVIKIKK
ncbi:MAG: DegQ family serine endoprotease [Desulfobacterales bacterium]